MELFLDTIKKDEKIILALRKLYEQLGYKKYKMSKFEEYDLYVENKNFLASENIITFTDMNGKLLALKPDVTLSIVKNTKADRLNNQKLYYIENVYRLSKQNREYKEINQMGLEFLGDVDLYSIIEVIRLAISSLAKISDRFILEISHMGFVTALLDSLNVDFNKKTELLACIRAKNAHELKTSAEKMGLSCFYQDKLVKIATLYGDFEQTLREAEQIVINNDMQKAINDLKEFYQAISFSKFAKNIQLDFSIINDIDYYSGIIFQGYVENIPHAILAGGRYDNLMKKFGKDIGAIGFAIYLNELERYDKHMVKYDVDTVILYDVGADYGKLSCEVQKLIDSGLSVRTEKNIPCELRFKKLYRYQDGRLEEVPYHA
ncbi:MAG: ATP phosphoribosyltransferase regulatory subunit [Bacillota bacterium]|jgi:ATP phosphoribosyltransferase regulatory subunit